MYVYVLDRNSLKIRRVEVSSQRVVTLVSQAGSTALNNPVGATWLTQDSVLFISNGDSNSVVQMFDTCVPPTSSPTLTPTSSPNIPSGNPTSQPTSLPTSIQSLFVSQGVSMVFAGQWTNSNSRRPEAWLAQLDPECGDVIRVVSFAFIDEGASKGMGLLLNDDGSPLIAGTTASASHSRALVLLVEFSSNIIWSLALQGATVSQSYSFNDATRLANGDNVMVGQGCVSGACVGTVLRVSANGEWRHTSQWGVKGSDKAYSIARCRDGGYAIAAASRDYAPTDSIEVLRFDSKDRLQWAVMIAVTKTSPVESLLLMTMGI